MTKEKENSLNTHMLTWVCWENILGITDSWNLWSPPSRITVTQRILEAKNEWHILEMQFIFLIYFLLLALDAVVLMVCVTKVAKTALDKALAENEDIDGIVAPAPQLPVVSDPPSGLQQPLVVKVDPAQDNQEKWNMCPVNSSPTFCKRLMVCLFFSL